MKKIIVSVICCVMLTSCSSSSVGIIGGADGPTSIVVGKQVVDQDEWGIKFYAEEVSDKGVTVVFRQKGGNVDGTLQTGEWFSIDKNKDGKWTPVPINPLIDFAWDDLVYEIEKNNTFKMGINWEWLYGSLEPGEYRLNKKIIHINKKDQSDEKVYSVNFRIKQ